MKPALLIFFLFFQFFLGQAFLSGDLCGQSLQTGKGYLNITKGLSGGTFEAGDTLEIRATIARLSGGSISRVRYVDTIPDNTSFVPGSLRLMTNEGVEYRSFSDAANDDDALYDPSDKTLKIHVSASDGSLGSGYARDTDPYADDTRAPGFSNSNQPSLFGSGCIIVASYRIVIDPVSIGTVINAKGGAFYYRSSGTQVASLPSISLLIASNLGLCSNKVSKNSVIENAGTFGEGSSRNRGTSSTLGTEYGFVNMGANSPGDGNYSLANNTSGDGSADNSVPGKSSKRVFTVWEISGDHTNATDPVAGNPATAAGTSGGYMLIINASYANGVAVSQSINNLCDETYYEFSAWFKNICRYCGCDITGKGAFTSGYNTAFPGDSSGVKPNLTFEVNGEAMYTTGDIPFTGTWVKKGFIFKTKPGVNIINIRIRNNSGGGGGNDWAMDDLALSICGPGISVTPTSISDCNNNYVDMAATVQYFEQNFGAFIWEKSIDGGNTWVTTPEVGEATPIALPGGQYEYTVHYPSLYVTQADSGNRYRVRVATNLGNLSSEACSYLDTTVASLTIFDCQVLDENLISFTGKSINNRNYLYWITGNETRPVVYSLEKSTDGTYYRPVTVQSGMNKKDVNNYSYADTAVPASMTWYRLKITDPATGRSKYAPVVILNNSTAPGKAAINVFENPFYQSITIEVSAFQQQEMSLRLYNLYGKQVKSTTMQVETGYKKLNWTGLESLPAGLYALEVRLGDQVVTKKMIKR